MYEQFQDRVLTCADCHGEFVFTAGEQVFFFDKQFKNDPKRCKPCKSRRSGLAAVANGNPNGMAAAGISRTETRTNCSECGVETTVPFKPTQGRPVLCRGCFQGKSRATTRTVPPPVMQAEVAALVGLDSDLQRDAAVLAAASMSAAGPNSSVATPADLAMAAGSLDPESEAAMAGEAARTVRMIAETPLQALQVELLAESLPVCMPDSVNA